MTEIEEVSSSRSPSENRATRRANLSYPASSNRSQDGSRAPDRRRREFRAVGKHEDDPHAADDTTRRRLDRPSRRRHSCSLTSTPRSSASPSGESSKARRIASRSGIVSARPWTRRRRRPRVSRPCHRNSCLGEGARSRARPDLEPGGRRASSGRSYVRSRGRVSDTSGEAKRAGSAFSVFPDGESPSPPGGRWVAGPANCRGSREVADVSLRPPPAARLANPDAVLTRTDVAEFGYERRAVDAIFRACPVEAWEGYSRPMIRVADFLEWRERATYSGDRVRA
jgi:hypothetical protein